METLFIVNKWLWIAVLWYWSCEIMTTRSQMTSYDACPSRGTLHLTECTSNTTMLAVKCCNDTSACLGGVSSGLPYNNATEYCESHFGEEGHVCTVMELDLGVCCSDTSDTENSLQVWTGDDCTEEGVRYCATTSKIQITEFSSEYVIADVNVVVRLKQATQRQWIYLKKKREDDVEILLAANINSSSSVPCSIKFDDEEGIQTADNLRFPTDDFVYISSQPLSILKNNMVAGDYELLIKVGNNKTIDHSSLVSWCLEVKYRKASRIISTFFVDLSSVDDTTKICAPYSTMTFDSNGVLRMNESRSYTGSDSQYFYNMTCPGLFHTKTIEACLRVINETRLQNPEEAYLHTCEFVVYDISCGTMSLNDSTANVTIFSWSGGSGYLPAEMIWTSPYYMQANQHSDWFPNQTVALNYIPWFMQDDLSTTYKRTCIHNPFPSVPTIYSESISIYFYGFNWEIDYALMKIITKESWWVNLVFYDNDFTTQIVAGNIIYLATNNDAPWISTTFEKSRVFSFEDGAQSTTASFLRIVGGAESLSIEECTFGGFIGMIVQAVSLRHLVINGSTFDVFSSQYNSVTDTGVIDIQNGTETIDVIRSSFAFDTKDTRDFIFRIDVWKFDTLNVAHCTFHNISYATIFDVAIYGTVPSAMTIFNTTFESLNNVPITKIEMGRAISTNEMFSITMNKCTFYRMKFGNIDIRAPVDVVISDSKFHNLTSSRILCRECVHFTLANTIFHDINGDISASVAQRSMISIQRSYGFLTTNRITSVTLENVAFSQVILPLFRRLLLVYNVTSFSASNVNYTNCVFPVVLTTTSHVKLNNIRMENTLCLPQDRQRWTWDHTVTRGNWHSVTSTTPIGLVGNNIRVINSDQSPQLLLLISPVIPNEASVNLTNFKVDGFNGDVIIAQGGRSSFSPYAVTLKGFEITNSEFTRISNGRCIYVDAPEEVTSFGFGKSYVTVIVSSISFRNLVNARALMVSQTVHLLDRSVAQPATLSVTDCTFRDFVESASIQFSGSWITVESAIFENMNSTVPVGLESGFSVMEINLIETQSATFLQSIRNVRMARLNFEDPVILVNGGTTTSLTVENVNFTETTGGFKGIGCQNITLNNVKFISLYTDPSLLVVNTMPAVIIENGIHALLVNSVFMDLKGHTRMGGAALMNTLDTVTIVDCIFSNNRAAEGSGALMIISAYNTTITGCIFRENGSPGDGGAVYIGNEPNKIWDFSVTTTITNTTFTSNSASYAGGALRMNQGSLYLTNSFFDYNSAALGGALALSDMSNISIDNCHFTNGVASTSGGVLLAVGGSRTEQNEFSPEKLSRNITRSFFFKNNASLTGGVFDFSAQNWNIEKCEFKDNNGGQSGGVVYVSSSDSTLRITDSKFKNNHAENGGCFGLQRNPPFGNTLCILILNNTIFEENTACYYGGIINSEDFSVEMKDSHINGNCSSNPCDDGGLCARQGGGITMTTEQPNIFSTIELNSVTMQNLQTQIGGGLLIRHNADAKLEVKLIDLVFEGNSASEIPSSGDIGIFQQLGATLNVTKINLASDVKKTSFPKTLTFTVDTNATCPNCEIIGEVDAIDVFGEPFVPVESYCDVNDVCSRLSLSLNCTTALQPNGGACINQEPSGKFNLGHGNITFDINYAATGEEVNVSLVCQTNRGPMCPFETTDLSHSIQFSDCPKDKERQYIRDGSPWFECTNIDFPNYDLTLEVGSSYGALSIIILVILIIIGLFLLGWLHELNVMVCMGYCRHNRVQQTRPLALLRYILKLLDTFTDINLCQAFWKAYIHVKHHYGAADAQIWLSLAICGTVFLVVPWLINIIMTVVVNYRILDLIPFNKYAQSNYVSRRLIIAMLVVFSGDFYTALELLNCRLFGLTIFQLGLTPHELRRFNKFRLFSTVLLQNIPQVVLQLTALGHTDDSAADIQATVILALCMSVLTISSTVLGFWLDRTKIYRLDSFELVIKLHFSSQVNPSAKDMVSKKIQQNRGRYQAIIQPMVHHCKDLTSNQVVVGSVDVASDTITIYGNILDMTSNNVGSDDFERTKSLSSVEKYTKTQGSNTQICQAVLFQGFKLEKELKGYMQSSHPKVSIKGSYFKIFDKNNNNNNANNTNNRQDDVQSVSEDFGESPSHNSVELASSNNREP